MSNNYNTETHYFIEMNDGTIWEYNFEFLGSIRTFPEWIRDVCTLYPTSKIGLAFFKDRPPIKYSFANIRNAWQEDWS